MEVTLVLKFMSLHLLYDPYLVMENKRMFMRFIPYINLEFRPVPSSLILAFTLSFISKPIFLIWSAFVFTCWVMQPFLLSWEKFKKKPTNRSIPYWLRPHWLKLNLLFSFWYWDNFFGLNLFNDLSCSHLLSKG